MVQETWGEMERRGGIIVWETVARPMLQSTLRHLGRPALVRLSFRASLGLLRHFRRLRRQRLVDFKKCHLQFSQQIE